MPTHFEYMYTTIDIESHKEVGSQRGDYENTILHDATLVDVY
jgi:hypothetical protein